MTEPGGVRWLMLLLVLVAQTVVQAGLQSAAPLAPFLQADLQINRAQVGLLGSALSAGTIAIAFPAGWLADRLGARLLLAGGAVATGSFLLLASRAPSYWLMAVLFFLAGIGFGTSATAASKAVVSWFAARTRGTAMGIKQTGTSLGGGLVALILPGVALATDWRNALLLTGAAVMAVGLFVLLGYRDSPSSQPARRVAPRGGLLSVLGKRNMQFASVATFCFTGVQLSLLTYLVLYFTEARGLAVTMAGQLLALAQLGGIAGRILLGSASDRLFDARRKGLLLFTGTASTVASTILATLGTSLPFEALFGLVLVIGFVAVGWTGLFMIMAAELAGKDAAGQGSAAALFSGSFGYFAMPPLFGLIVDATHSYPLALLTMALTSAIGVAAMTRVREGADLEKSLEPVQSSASDSRR